MYINYFTRSIECAVLLVLLSMSQVWLPAQSEAAVSASAAQQIGTQSLTSGSPAQKLPLIEFFSYNSVESKIVRDQILTSGPTANIIKEYYQLKQFEEGRFPELESRYGITKYPTVIIAAADGSEIDRIVGFRHPAEYAAILQAAATGKSEISRLKEQAASAENDIGFRIELAVALQRRNNYAEALQHYQWVLDNGARFEPHEYSATFRVVVSYMMAMAEDYPLALEDLHGRRDRAEQVIIGANPEAPTIFEQAFIFNEMLKEPSRNRGLYLKIPADSAPKQRLFGLVFIELIKAGNYKEVSEIVDLENFVGALYPRFRFEMGHSTHDGHDHSKMENALNQRIGDWSLAACEGLIALGELEKAKRVAARALDWLGQDASLFRPRFAQLQVKINTTDAISNVKSFSDWITNYQSRSK